jgi:hypothetical protein
MTEASCGCLTEGALSCEPRLRSPTEVPKCDARRLPDFDWNALCHVSCSALLGGGRVHSGVGLGTVTSAKKLIPAIATSSATPAR